MTAPGSPRHAGEQSLHASAVVARERAALIRGPSGSGKSALCLAMIEIARRSGDYAALVGDDRVFARVASGRLLVRGVPGFEGLIERRGEGVLVETFEPRAVAWLVVDLPGPEANLPRWPEDEDGFTEIMGLRLRRLTLDSRPGPVAGAFAALRALAAAA
jgi:serine kinase of HPr protein (carbohydrate metabolism regulator)